MKRLISCLVVLFLIGLVISPAVSADVTDRIEKYEIKVEPQPDGALLNTYSILWHYVKNAGSDLTWMELGLPNSSFEVVSFTSNPQGTISQGIQGGSGVTIHLSQPVKVGGYATFTVQIKQQRIAYLNKDGNVTFQFTPGWYDDYPVDSLTISWQLPNASQIKEIKPQPASQDGNLAVWQTSLQPKGKFTVNLVLAAEAFPELKATNAQTPSETASRSGEICGLPWLLFLFLAVVVIVVVVTFYLIFRESGSGGGDGGGNGDTPTYHSGSYLGGYHSPSSSLGSSGSSPRSSGGSGHFDGRGSSCVSSCVHSCACACACAGGGGHAGCKAKGFIIKTKNLSEAIGKQVKDGKIES